MKEILTADQMRRSDQRMIQKMQVPSLVLMERAALQCVAAMKAEDIDLSKALVVCGSGNNGGSVSWRGGRLGSRPEGPGG